MDIRADGQVIDWQVSGYEPNGTSQSKNRVVIAFEDWVDGTRLDKHEEVAYEDRETTEIGLEVGPTDDIEALTKDLSNFDFIELRFDKYGDGQHFSNVRLLKEAMGFTGLVIASGILVPDQLFYLFRVGFDIVRLSENASEEDIAKYLATFSNVYQSAGDQRSTIRQQRWRH